MTQEPRQDTKDGSADSPLHKAWVSLITTLGTPLTAALAVLVGMLIVLLAVGFVWYLMPVFAFKNGLTIPQRKDLVQGLASVVQALAVVLTGTVGLIGLLFTWRNLNQTRESTQRSLELTEQGQITERFTRAIDHLGATDDNGDPRLEIRLGGIYALERIDKESPERAYHGTVIEVLAAYVWENSHRDSGKSSTPTSAANEAAEQDEEGVEHDAELITHNPPAADIQVILDVLKRREEERVPKMYSVRLDLQEAYLVGVNLQGADLQEAYLQEADLRGAILQEANLRGAYLGGAYLQEAILQQADLQEADLQEADLRGAYLQDAYLQDAILQGAYLQDAILLKAYLQGAALRGAALQGAILQGAYLVEANLVEANLQGAALQGADLQGAYLWGANLQDAYLQDAKVTTEQLAVTLSLQGATMPDGRKYEEWRKDEGSGAED